MYCCFSFFFRIYFSTAIELHRLPLERVCLCVCVAIAQSYFFLNFLFTSIFFFFLLLAVYEIINSISKQLKMVKIGDLKSLILAHSAFFFFERAFAGQYFAYRLLQTYLYNFPLILSLSIFLPSSTICFEN